MTLPLFLLAALADPVGLAPTGNWTLRYADMACVLTRDYGAGADKLTFGFRTMPARNGREMLLVVPGNAMADKGPAAITLLPGGQPITGQYERGGLSAGGQVAIMFLPESALAGLDKVNAVEVRLGTADRSFAVPGFATAVTALAGCQDDLFRRWGIDPAERKLELPVMQGNPGRIFSVTAYPAAAARARAQGLALAVAAIDRRGGVTACKVVVSSGNKPLDDATCQIIRGKARFTPAHDKAGTAVAAHYVMPVRWSLPRQ